MLVDSHSHAEMVNIPLSLLALYLLHERRKQINHLVVIHPHIWKDTLPLLRFKIVLIPIIPFKFKPQKLVKPDAFFQLVMGPDYYVIDSLVHLVIHRSFKQEANCKAQAENGQFFESIVMFIH